MNCYVCRDKGVIGGCEECGLVIERSGNKPVEITTEVLETYQVPEYYRSNVWDSSVLKRSLPAFETHKTFNAYCNQLDKIHKIFKDGFIPQQSCLIIAPQRRGKQIFAFTCLSEAIAHGYSAVPMLDTSEWRRINLMSAERALSKEVKAFPWSIDQIVSADIVFLTVDKDNYQGAFRAIESLLDKRSRRNKPTFIISRYTVEQISYLDFEDTFEATIDKTRQLNQLKYLGLIVGE